MIETTWPLAGRVDRRAGGSADVDALRRARVDVVAEAAAVVAEHAVPHARHESGVALVADGRERDGVGAVVAVEDDARDDALVDRHHQLQRAARGERLRRRLAGERGLIGERARHGRSRRAAGERRRETDGCRCQQGQRQSEPPPPDPRALGSAGAGPTRGQGSAMGSSCHPVDGTACASWCRGNSRRSHCPISKNLRSSRLRRLLRRAAPFCSSRAGSSWSPCPSSCSSDGSSQAPSGTRSSSSWSRASSRCCSTRWSRRSRRCASRAGSPCSSSTSRSRPASSVRSGSRASRPSTR